MFSPELLAPTPAFIPPRRPKSTPIPNPLLLLLFPELFWSADSRSSTSHSSDSFAVPLVFTEIVSASWDGCATVVVAGLAVVDLLKMLMLPLMRLPRNRRFLVNVSVK